MVLELSSRIFSNWIFQAEDKTKDQIAKIKAEAALHSLKCTKLIISFSNFLSIIFEYNNVDIYKTIR